MSDSRYYRPNAFPPVVKNLIIINALVFLAQLVLDRQFNLTDKLALYPVTSPEFKPYQIATHMFTHAPSNIFHLLFNMFALWMFGRQLENFWGPKRFLLFYLVCGVGAAVFHLAVEYFTGGMSAAVGASGAVMGVLVAFAYLFPNTTLFIMPIPFPIKAKWAVMGYIAFEIFSGVTGRDAGVAHFAHIGGAITGFLLVLIWNKSGKNRFY